MYKMIVWVVIELAFCLDVGQGHMNGALNETDVCMSMSLCGGESLLMYKNCMLLIYSPAEEWSNHTTYTIFSFNLK